MSSPPSRRAARAALLLLSAVVLAACGVGTDGRTGPATPSSTPLPPPPTTTLPPPPATLEPSPESVEAEPLCPDPYPAGAPFATSEGELVRVAPGGPAPALPPTQPLPLVRDRDLERVIEDAIGDQGEHFAVVVRNLADGRGATLAAGRSFYAASLFKTWVMLEAYHQREAGLLDFGERYIAADYYRQFGLNSSDLGACEEVSMGDALARMMAISDNVAANLLLDRLGAGNVNAALANLGLAASGFRADGSLPTTAHDMALLLEGIARRQAVSPAASEEMLALLASETLDDRLPALLPAGTSVAHKTGSWHDATHDAGVVFSPQATYLIVVLTDFGFTDRGALAIARVSRAVYDYYSGQRR